VAEGKLSIALQQQRPIPLDIAFECRVGEVLALVGPSGSGKTTILRAIAGLFQPASGFVSINAERWFDSARNIHLPPHRRRVGLVFQNYALFPHMSALQNIVAALGHRPKAERIERARQLLALVNLDGFDARKPSELSGGQQQRVAVARALAREPEVLLLDEPFAAVDKKTRRILYAELSELRRSLAMPVIFVTHDFDEAARLADSMCLIHHGKLLQKGSPRDVLARPASALAARVIDSRNLFRGKVVRHEGDRTWLDWNGRPVEAMRQDGFPPGAAVSWVIPATQVIISRTDGDAPRITSNLFAATIRDLAHLSESVAVTVVLHGTDSPRLSLTLPAHYARRKGLQPGTGITVALAPDGVHLMPPE
jgi:molybdate transport system ATP-binding protein